MSKNDSPKATPPRLAIWLLERCLDDDAFEAIAGDIEEEFNRRSVIGSAAAKRWFFSQSVASLVAVFRNSLRPTNELTLRPRKGDSMLLRLANDIRFALRGLARAPGFAATVILVLSLSMGATITIYTLVENFLRRPLHFQDPDRVAFILGWDTERDGMRFSTAFADNLELRENAQSFEDVAAYRYWSVNLSGDGVPERVQGYHVTRNLFDLLGVSPSLGAGLSGESSTENDELRVVLSFELWQRRFGGDANVVGKEIRIDGRPYTVAGVMPRPFEFPLFNYKGALFAPFEPTPAGELSDRNGLGGNSVVSVARIRPSVNKASAQSELDTIAQRLATTYPQNNRGVGFRLFVVQDMLSDQMGPALWLLFAAVGFVLLIAGANVSQLLLSRGISREAELSVRAALGAGRTQLFSTVAVESVLLSIAGGLAGLGITPVLLNGIKALMPDSIGGSLPVVDAFSVGAPTLAFAALLVVVTGSIFSLPAAWIPLKRLGPSTLGATRGVAGGSAVPLRRILVASQLSVCLILLVSGALVLRGVVRLLDIDPGFDGSNASTFSVALPETRYANADERVSFYRGLADRVRAIPGVESAGWVNSVPFSSSDSGTGFQVDGTAPDPTASLPRARYRIVTPGYLDALGTTLLDGRDFRESDLDTARRVAIVNQSMASEYLGGRAVGQRIHLSRSADSEPLEVVGVVRDVAHMSLTESVRPEIYIPIVHHPQREMALVVRSGQSEQALMPRVRAEMHAMDPEQAMFQVATLDDLVRTSLAAQRIVLTVLLVFGATTLFLAGIGLYGLISFLAAQRQKELGIRVALGARPRDLSRLLVGGGLRLTSIGIGLGLTGAWFLSRFLSSILEGLDTRDPLSFIVCALALTAVALLASYLPARRAKRMDPVSTLRLS